MASVVVFRMKPKKRLEHVVSCLKRRTRAESFQEYKVSDIEESSAGSFTDSPGKRLKLELVRANVHSLQLQGKVGDASIEISCDDSTLAEDKEVQHDQEIVLSNKDLSEHKGQSVVLKNDQNAFDESIEKSFFPFSEGNVVVMSEQDDALTTPASFVCNHNSLTFDRKKLPFPTDYEEYVVSSGEDETEPELSKNITDDDAEFACKRLDCLTKEVECKSDLQEFTAKLPSDFKPLVLKISKVEWRDLELKVPKKRLDQPSCNGSNSETVKISEDLPCMGDSDANAEEQSPEGSQDILSSHQAIKTKKKHKKRRPLKQRQMSLPLSNNLEEVQAFVDEVAATDGGINDCQDVSFSDLCATSPDVQILPAALHVDRSLGKKVEKAESIHIKRRTDKSSNLTSRRKMDKRKKRRSQSRDKQLLQLAHQRATKKRKKLADSVDKATDVQHSRRMNSKSEPENFSIRAGKEDVKPSKKDLNISRNETSDHHLSDSDDVVEIITLPSTAQATRRKPKEEFTTQNQRLDSKQEKGMKKERLLKRSKEKVDNKRKPKEVERKPKDEQTQKKLSTLQETARKSAFGVIKHANSGGKSAEGSSASGAESSTNESEVSDESSWNSDSDIKQRLFSNDQKKAFKIASRTRNKIGGDENHFESLQVSDRELVNSMLRRKHSSKLKKKSKLNERSVAIVSSGSGEEDNTSQKTDISPDSNETNSKERKHATTQKKRRGISTSDDDDVDDDDDNNLNSSESGSSEDDNLPSVLNDSSLDEADKRPRTKGMKRKACLTSDSDSKSSSDESEDADASDSQPTMKKKKKKRKLALSLSDDSEDLGDDDSPSKRTGRRNLRKIMGDEKLSKETKAAQVEEKRRLERLRKRSLNLAEWTPTKAHEKEKHLVLETVAGDSTQPLVEVSDYLVPRLKEHQVQGIRFMWDCVFESVDEACKTDGGSGCILAHCMGLGKTLQVVALIDIIMRNRDLFDLSRILVMAPKNALNVWINELKSWLPEEELPEIWHLHGVTSNQTRLEIVSDWHLGGGVLIVGYEMYRNLSQAQRIRKKDWRDEFKRVLQDPGPDVVVCDEGHVLRNWDSALSKAVNRIRTKRRIVLTGTPLQNNLNEYYTMVSFVKPNLLGTHREFTNRFANPISNGQHSDSTATDVRIMKHRAHVLHEILTSVVQRKDFSVLLPYLPAKYEYVIFVRLNDLQIKLYRRYLEKCVDSGARLGQRGVMGVFESYHQLMRVWSHPFLLKMKEEELLDRLEKNELRQFIATDDDDTSESEPETEKKREEVKGGMDSGDEEVVNAGAKGPTTRSEGSPVANVADSWFEGLVTDDLETDIELSSKFYILMEIVRSAEAVGDKVLVFSQSLLTLNLLESFIQEEEFGGFCLGIDYYRLDGSSSADSRQAWADNFNSKKKKRLRLFLISTRAGSLGVTLTGANRVVIMDAAWNPTLDTQSLFRVFRFGQEKPVYVYRLIAQGTMEERVYDRQVTKQSLSHRVVDERQIERHFTLSDLLELYKFDPDVLTDDSKPPSDQKDPQDPLLSYLLERFQPRWIIRYHEHSTLLEDQVNERLTDEEKKVAWEQYELEKNRPRGEVNVPGSVQPLYTTAAGLAEIQRENERRLQYERIAAARNHSIQQLQIRPMYQVPGVQEQAETQLLLQQRHNPVPFAASMVRFMQYQPQLYHTLVSQYPQFAVTSASLASAQAHGLQVSGTQPQYANVGRADGIHVWQQQPQATGTTSTSVVVQKPQ